MRKTIDEFVHEIDQDFALASQEEWLDFVERIADPSGRVNENQREGIADEGLDLFNRVFELARVGHDLEVSLRLMKRRHRGLELSICFWIALREIAANASPRSIALEYFLLRVPILYSSTVKYRCAAAVAIGP